MCIHNLVLFCQFVLKILSKNQILTSIKGRNSVANLRKTKIYNTNLDLVTDNVCTNFGLILSICSQDIDQKPNFDFNQGPNFELVRDVMNVLVTCKYEKDPIKNVGATVVTTLFLQVTRTCMKAWMSSNFGQIPTPTPELSALECLKIAV